MKKAFLLVIILFIGKITQAQNNLPANGNIGIGTLSPTKAIQIGNYGSGNENSQLLIPGVYNFEQVRLGQIGNGNNLLEFVNHTGVESSYGMRLMTNIDHSGQGLQFQYALSQNSYDALSYQTGMFLTTGGRLGIGTLNPESKLHIQSDANTSGAPANAQVIIGGVTSSGKRLSLAYNTSSNYAEMQSQSHSGTYTPITFNPNGGNVGIGTTTPTEKLSVNGKIRAHEIKVEIANWPDYVFARSYNLPTLQETESHIRQKGHLPGIPSAEEVKKNGVDLGEINAKLLQKIEELTLHLIEMKKDAEMQKNQLQTLQLKLDELKFKSTRR